MSSRRATASKATKAAPMAKISFRCYAPVGFGEEVVVVGDTLARPPRPPPFRKWTHPPVP